MSDTAKEKAAAAKEKAITAERSQVEPKPADLKLFEWLEVIFYGEPEAQQAPQSIDVTPLAGKRYERMLRPIMTRMFDKDTKPARSKIADIANEILFRVQRDCDIQRRRTVYGVNVRHYTIDPQPY